MPNVINLLPDNVANQIAAGEVIQRPASAVKELLENSIDAGATRIDLVIKDAGKGLIQIIDNGCGMSVTDARLCFERHATSKVKTADDLFSITTMGFRGEAMASIAAIAQVELKTRRHTDDIGTCLHIQGAVVTGQEPVNCPAGTQILVKNLFYNTPARRNFLKSTAVEMRHIIDEFTRASMAYPHIFFTLTHNGQQVFHMPGANLMQRITQLLGHNYAQRLVPVTEDTSIIKIEGFIGKPEFAKKTRGEQFFFMNNRFIKDSYLNHAVTSAFQFLLPDDAFPLYVLFITIDPARIDVNVHPTKTEVKYMDERSVYAILKAAITRSIGKYQLSPSIDFDAETTVGTAVNSTPPADIRPPEIKVNAGFNPFNQPDIGFRSSSLNPSPSFGTAPARSPVAGHSSQAPKSVSGTNWQQLYKINEHNPTLQSSLNITYTQGDLPDAGSPQVFLQLQGTYILSEIKSGLMIIDQQAAHERILYERYLSSLTGQPSGSQQSLFPVTVQLNPADYELAKSLLSDIRSLGFQLRDFGPGTFVIEGIPADIAHLHVTEAQLLENLLESYKNSLQALKLNKRESLAYSMAKNTAIKAGTRLSQPEMMKLVEQLFLCQSPNIGINGKAVVQTMYLADIAKKFER